MTHAQNKVKWCLRKAEKEGIKHRGLVKVQADMQKAMAHFAKAERNAKLMVELIRLDYSDWAVSAAFYAQYHCLLAVLWKFGYESRNQECTIAAIEHLIEEGKVNLRKEDIQRIMASSEDQTLERTDIVSLRERFQYGTETATEVRQIQSLLKETRELIDECRTVLQE